MKLVLPSESDNVMRTVYQPGGCTTPPLLRPFQEKLTGEEPTLVNEAVKTLLNGPGL